jgi:hypothetical protein
VIEVVLLHQRQLQMPVRLRRGMQQLRLPAGRLQQTVPVLVRQRVLML